MEVRIWNTVLQTTNINFAKLLCCSNQQLPTLKSKLSLLTFDFAKD